MIADILFESAQEAEQLNGIEKKRYQLKKKIIRHLYEHGAKSNPEICKSTNMSSPSITGLLHELIEQNIVEEVGAGNSSGGRRPNMYGLRGNSRYVVGIDIARYATYIAVFNIKNELIAPITEFPIVLAQEDTVIEKVQLALHEVLRSTKLGIHQILAIGIDMPGLIDSHRGINFTMLHQAHGTLRDAFEARLGRPCYLENDARMMALGEYRFGLAQGRNNVLCLKVSWGLGLGMILNGKVYHGHTGFAGEFGHIQAKPDGELCTCGKRGCLETLSSAKALTKFAHEGLASGSVSILSDRFAKPEQITAQAVIEAAHNGDEFSIHILAKIGNELGRGLATLIHLMNPEAIIIGGLLSEAEQYLTAPIQHAINKYCIPNISRETAIIISELRHLAGVKGAAALVWEKVLNDPTE